MLTKQIKQKGRTMNDNKMIDCVCDNHELDSYSSKGEYVDELWDVMFECIKKFKFEDIMGTANYVYESYLNCEICLVTSIILRGFMWKCLDLPDAEPGVTDKLIHEFCVGAKEIDIEEMRHFTKKHMSVTNVTGGVGMAHREWLAVRRIPIEGEVAVSHIKSVAKIVELLTTWSELRQEEITKRKGDS